MFNYVHVRTHLSSWLMHVELVKELEDLLKTKHDNDKKNDLKTEKISVYI